MKIPRGRWLDAPRWVNFLYAVLEWIDYHVTTPISRWTYYRYVLLARHCACENCKRLAEQESQRST